MFDDGLAGHGEVAGVVPVATPAAIIDYSENLRLPVHHDDARIMREKEVVRLINSFRHAVVVELIRERRRTLRRCAVEAFHSVKRGAALTQLTPSP